MWDIIPAYVVYQENKSQGHDWFFEFFSSTYNGKIFQIFSLVIYVWKYIGWRKLHEKKN